MAPIACSVRVEIAMPIAPSEDIAVATYSATNSSRTIPPASDTVVPDSSVTGPMGNRAAPVARATAVTPNVTASANSDDHGVLHGEDADSPGRNR